MRSTRVSLYESRAFFWVSEMQIKFATTRVFPCSLNFVKKFFFKISRLQNFQYKIIMRHHALEQER